MWETRTSTVNNVRLGKQQKPLRNNRRPGEKLLQIPPRKQVNTREGPLHFRPSRPVHQSPKREITSDKKNIHQPRPPMKKQSPQVRFNGKPLIRSLTIKRFPHPAQLRSKALHILPIPNMLNHRIGKSQIKRLVRELQPPSVPNHARVSSGVQLQRILVEQRNLIQPIQHAPNLRRSPDIQHRAVIRIRKRRTQKSNPPLAEPAHKELSEPGILHAFALMCRQRELY
jgi:hypothetical protein